MNATFFRIAFGEELTFESLLHHLPSLKAKALAGQPKTLLLATARLTPADITPAIALGVLHQHLSELDNAVYGKLDKDESWGARRKAIATAILPWFANIHREDVIGVSLAQAATLSGFDPQTIRALVLAQLQATNSTFAPQVEADVALGTLLTSLRSAADLYDPVQEMLHPAALLATARAALEQAAALPLGKPLSQPEALYLLTERIGSRLSRLRRYCKADPVRAQEVLKDLTGIGTDLAA